MNFWKRMDLLCNFRCDVVGQFSFHIQCSLMLKEKNNKLYKWKKLKRIIVGDLVKRCHSPKFGVNSFNSFDRRLCNDSSSAVQ